MPAFRTATVSALISDRSGIQRIETTAGRAYVLTALVGEVRVGDQVILNTTAVDLGLGTGGWHVVHWNLRHQDLDLPGPGHIMKLRYTSLQVDTGSAEELHGDLVGEVDHLRGLPVIVCGLHSQMAVSAAVFRARRPEDRLVYVMTDGAALPVAISELVHRLRQVGVIDATITAGHAFGGDHEAVSVPGALAVAAAVENAGAVVCAMGPGVVGTSTTLGFSAIEVGSVVDAVTALGGRPVVALRYSGADMRSRHRGVSHHSITALTRGCVSRARVAVPAGRLAAPVREILDHAGVSARHDIVEGEAADTVDVLTTRGLEVRSMGRGPSEDPGFYEVAGAAGAVAADLLPDS